jgi:hypothetical protein
MSFSSPYVLDIEDCLRSGDLDLYGFKIKVESLCCSLLLTLDRLGITSDYCTDEDKFVSDSELAEYWINFLEDKRAGLL